MLSIRSITNIVLIIPSPFLNRKSDEEKRTIHTTTGALYTILQIRQENFSQKEPIFKIKSRIYY